MAATAEQELEYTQDVERWVQTARAGGAVTFGELLNVLPGVYPSTLLTIINKLQVNEQVLSCPVGFDFDSSNFLADEVPSNEQNRSVSLPLPHPLDYEWRFSHSASEYIVESCMRFTKPTDSVVLLGAPSVLKCFVERSYPRRAMLIDENKALGTSFTSRGDFLRYDLLNDELPNVLGSVVVADPPWYEQHTMGFLWAACKFCEIGGTVLLILPPVGTRPGVLAERAHIFHWASELGLEHTRTEESVITYISPLFEVNALRAESIQVPLDWRRADLASFTYRQRIPIARPAVERDVVRWDETILSSVRFRVRHEPEMAFRDPSLVRVIHGDVLPSVSSRDDRRKLAAVWTSGNRIYGCQGPRILHFILDSLAKNIMPEHVVSEKLNSSLTNCEISLIRKTVDQVLAVVTCEQGEQANYLASSPH